MSAKKSITINQTHPLNTKTTTVDSITLEGQEASSNQVAVTIKESITIKVVPTINAWTTICEEEAVVVVSVGAEARVHLISMMVRIITVALEVVSIITIIRAGEAGTIMAMEEASTTIITRTTTATMTIRIITTLEAALGTIEKIIMEVAEVVAAAIITEAASTIGVGATTTAIIISTTATRGPSTHTTHPKVAVQMGATTRASMHPLRPIERTTMVAHKEAEPITTIHQLIESNSSVRLT